MNRAQAQLLLILVSGVCGCGTPTDRWLESRPETTPASGVVTFQGEPLEGAIVVFQPANSTGVGASAVTDDDGKFELRTFPPQLGAVPGRYLVTIVKTDTPEVVEDVDDPPPTRTVSLIPEKYGIPAESNLVAEIPDEGTDALEFELVK